MNNWEGPGRLSLSIVVAALVGGWAVASRAETPGRETEERIARVVSGLLADTAWADRYAPPATLAERMTRYHTPGVSIAVVDGGRIAWARGFGIRERGRPEPVTADTLFQAGSISKPVFALAVMRLWQEKRLDLDEDVNRYLTSWKVPAALSWQPRVTLRQILTHSAGLTVHGFPGYGVDEPLPTVVQVLKGDPPANTAPVMVNVLPGTLHRYSGGGTTVGQLLVTDLLSTPFPKLMRQLVLDDLEMTQSTFEQPLPKDRAARAATAHPWKGRPLEGRWHVYPEMAAAGLWTTASDLARAGVEVQQALEGKGKVLSRKTADAMLTPNAVGEGVGLGFFLEGEGNAVRFGHGGWDEGFVARAAFYKQRGQGAVVMINSNEGAAMIDEILRAIAKEYAWPGYFKEPAPASAASSDLDAFTGRYGEVPLEYVVSRDGDQLLLGLAGQQPLKLQRRGADAFELVGVDAQVSFGRTGGAIDSLKITQQGRVQHAQRQEASAGAAR